MKTCSLTTRTQADMKNGDTLVLPCEVNYYYITTQEQTTEAITELNSKINGDSTLIAIDVETTGFDPFTNKIVLLQIGTSDNIQYLFDCRTIDSKPLIEILSKNCWKVGHNIKFDAKFIKQELGITINRLFDTYIAEYILRGGEYSSGYGYSLDEVLKRRLAKELKLVSSTTTFAVNADDDQKKEKVKKQLQMSFTKMSPGEAFSEAQLAYAAQDVSAEMIFALAAWQTTELKQPAPSTLYDPSIEQTSDYEIVKQYEEVFPREKSLWDTAKMEFKFIEVLVEMEMLGMGFSKATHDVVLANIEQDYQDYRKEFLHLLAKKTPQKTLFGTAGINPDSNSQVLEELNRLKLKLPDTNSKNLEVKLRDLDPSTLEAKILQSLLNYRATSKLVQAFGSKLSDHLKPATNRIHCEVRQILDTGRMSTSNPNLQQIPSRIEWKTTGDPVKDAAIKARDGLRECFQARPGYRYVIFDYSAQELRVTAAIALEDRMLKAFIDGMDLHSFSVTLMYDENYADFVKKVEAGDREAKEKRTAAKVVSFGSLYGSGPSSLAKNLNIELEKAQDILDRFWAAYPSLKSAMNRYGELALKYGYSNTVLGRRRYYTDILEKMRWVEVETSPAGLQKKIEDAGMAWFFEKNGEVTYDNMAQAKKALMNRYKGEINRQAGNHHIQGTSADMTKLAAIYIRQELLSKKLDAQVVALIHDEIIVEAAVDVVDECYKIVEDNMKKALNLFCPNVPAAVDGHVSTTWKK